MTLSLDDARWRAAVQARLLGEATAQDDALLDTHVPAGEPHRSERALLDAIAALGDEPDDESPLSADDDRALAGALAAFDATPAREPAPVVAAPARRRWASIAWISGGLSLAAAAVLVLLQPGQDLTPRAPTSIAAAPAPTPSPDVAADEPAPPSAPTWTIVSGSATAVADAAASARLPEGVQMQARDETCARRQTADVCLADRSRFEARGAGALALLEGRARVQAHEEAAPSIDVGEASVVVAPHSVAVIERSVGGWSIRVDDGSAQVVASHERRTLHGGETLAIDEDEREPAPRATEGGSKHDTAAMLRQARLSWSAGDHEAALQTYARVRAVAPGSRAARVASVSAGELWLELGRPQLALQSFRRAQRGKGALAQDAGYGEIQALRALGKSAAADAATQRFLARYPDSAYGAKLRK